MSQRRLDGVRQTTPKPDAPPPKCADCGTVVDLTYYPSADEHACGPCSNGERESYQFETTPPPEEDSSDYEYAKGGIVDNGASFAGINKALNDRNREHDQFIADKMFPKVKVEDQNNHSFRYVPEDKLGHVPAHSKRIEMALAYGMSERKMKEQGLDRVTFEETRRLMQETLRWMPR